MENRQKEKPIFVLEDLHVNVEGKEILKGISLAIKAGEVHALMGPNASGKSTLANAIMGNPKYKVIQGRILFKGEDITALAPDERARRGLFLSFQYPIAIPGVTVINFLRMAMKSVRGEEIPFGTFRRLLGEQMARLKMEESLAWRYINEGFSGGEMKRTEILQMAMLQPAMAVLDETDSGLDIDALRIVAEAINSLQGPHLGILLITHYQRILNYVKPHLVHILGGGRIALSGGSELAQELEARGYEWFAKEVKTTPEVGQ